MRAMLLGTILAAGAATTSACGEMGSPPIEESLVVRDVDGRILAVRERCAGGLVQV